MLAVANSVEATGVDNDIRLDDLTPDVALKEPEMTNTDANIPIDNNCIDVEGYFRISEGSVDYKDEGDERAVRDAVPTTSWRSLPTTKLNRFDLGIIDVEGYVGENGHNVDADEEDGASQAHNRSTQKVKHSNHRRSDL
jgi:hypothetical protein